MIIKHINKRSHQLVNENYETNRNLKININQVALQILDLYLYFIHCYDGSKFVNLVIIFYQGLI